MLRTVTCIIFVSLFSIIVSAQKLSIPELQKIRTLKNTDRTKYLESRNYVQGITRSENGIQGFVYRCFVLEDNKPALKSVSLIVSDKLPNQILEYTISDSLEARDLQDWLLKHGFNNNMVTVEGKQMYFYRSRKSLLRFYSELVSLADSNRIINFTFAVGY